MVKGITKEKILSYLSEIPDPEIPVINIIELGVVRDVLIGDEVEVIITPTYSACPAMQMIEENIKTHLNKKGIKKLKITTVLSPAWTTDWITEDAHNKLNEYGIAPPVHVVKCPRCCSMEVECIGRFGSTPCKAQYRCLHCKEPFDYFKCH